MKKFAVLFLILFFQCSFPYAPGAESAIKVGVYNNEPLIFTDADGKVKGIFADIIEYVASSEGWQIEYVAGTWEQCLSRLENKQIDILCTMAFSKARDKLYDFNRENLLTNWGQLYVPAGSDIKTVTDAAGKKIAVLKGDIHYTIFTQIIKKFEIECEFIETDNYDSVLHLVAGNQADAGIVNRLFGIKYGEKYKLDKSGVIFNPIKIHYAVPEGESVEIIDTIDRYLASLKEDENSAYYTSLDKWLEAVSVKWTIPLWVKWAISVTLGLILFLFWGNLILRRRVNAKTRELTMELKHRKKIEKSLRESEQKYRSLLQALSDLVMMIDKNGMFTYLNPEFENLTGFSVRDFLGHSFTEILTPEYIESTVDRFKRGLSGEIIPSYEVELKHKEEKTVPVELKVTSLPDDDGNIIGRIGVARDITERKKAVASLRESEKKFRAMMEAMKDPVYICSPDYRVEYMNPTMIQRKGHDAAGEFCFKAMHDRNEKCPWCMHHKVQANKPVELDIISPKDNRHYHLSQSPIIHGDGSISNMNIFRDTTDLAKMESQLRQAQKMEAIGTLAGGIAHDFNNILFGIFGYLEMAIGEIPEGSSVRSHLEKVFTAARRAEGLVKQILTFSRRSEHELKPVKTQLVIKEALKLIKSSLPSTIEISQYIRKDCGPVLADPTQIHQVVMNLCTNAYHAMEETGGKLKVTLKEVELTAEDVKDPDMVPGPHVCLTVADTGPGMDRSVITRIFDPYFTTKEKGKGTGLGLAVVHGIVKSHGGHVSVYSEPGQGTEFHVYLPVIKNESESDKTAIDSPIQKGTERILLVDDEDVIVQMGKQMLERLGYHVTTRTGSMDALALFRAQPGGFDLVITDMTMPNMTGDKLAGELMKVRPGIPIILCTGFSELVSKEKTAALGIKDFLMKPIVMKDLSNVIRKVLDG